MYQSRYSSVLPNTVSVSGWTMACQGWKSGGSYSSSVPRYLFLTNLTRLSMFLWPWALKYWNTVTVSSWSTLVSPK